MNEVDGFEVTADHLVVRRSQRGFKLLHFLFRIVHPQLRIHHVFVSEGEQVRAHISSFVRQTLSQLRQILENAYHYKPETETLHPR